DLGVALDAAHNVCISAGGGNRRVDVDAGRAVKIGVVVALEAANQIRREKGVNMCLGLFDDKMPESWKCHTGRAALVDDRSDARAHSDHVGVQTEATSDILIDVSMGIDHSR